MNFEQSGERPHQESAHPYREPERMETKEEELKRAVKAFLEVRPIKIEKVSLRKAQRLYKDFDERNLYIIDRVYPETMNKDGEYEMGYPPCASWLRIVGKEDPEFPIIRRLFEAKEYERKEAGFPTLVVTGKRKADVHRYHIIENVASLINEMDVGRFGDDEKSGEEKLGVTSRAYQYPKIRRV